MTLSDRLVRVPIVQVEEPDEQPRGTDAVTSTADQAPASA